MKKGNPRNQVTIVTILFIISMFSFIPMFLHLRFHFHKKVIIKGKFMTRGDEDIEGGLQKFLDSRKRGYEKIRGGGSKNLYTLKPTGGGGGS